jgi:type IV pilus assembly protein PilO
MAWYNPTDPTQRNWMLGGIVVLALIYPFATYFMAPKHEANDLVRDRIETLDMQNTQAGVIVMRGGAGLEERMALYERHVARLEELIPAQEEVPALVDDIQARARVSNVEVVGLDPEPTQPAGPYNRTGYQMTVVGGYHEVARFLTEIASLPRIVTPVQIEMQTYSGVSQRADMVSPVQASFRIETYVLLDPTSIAPAELPGG